MRGGQVAFARVVSSLGTTVYAAHAIGLNVLGLSFMPGQAFAVAATTLVGQGLGARDPSRSERDARETIKWGLVVASSMGLMFFFFGKQIAWLYTDDAEVIALVATVLRFYAFFQPAQSSGFILSGALRGAGDAKWALYASLVGVWVFRFALASILVEVFGLGLMGAWIAMGVDQFSRWLITSLRFRTGRWKHLSI
jgi:putative MATE family efflux protein